jgi:hypothetical protein
MADVPHRLRALSLLNGIQGLGPKAGDDLDQLEKMPNGSQKA